MQFTDNTRSNSLLVISEGNDYFPRKTFKETVARAQQVQAACDVAMVADHTFYDTKGIQRYGFELRRLAGKTHGQYIEVGGKQEKVARSAERLSEGILSRAPKSTQRVTASQRFCGLLRQCDPGEHRLHACSGAYPRSSIKADTFTSPTVDVCGRAENSQN